MGGLEMYQARRFTKPGRLNTRIINERSQFKSLSELINLILIGIPMIVYSCLIRSFFPSSFSLSVFPYRRCTLYTVSFPLFFLLL
jgi:hypothetical protein